MLLDTNIVGYFFRNDSRAKAYEPHLEGKARLISFMTLGELYQWVHVRRFSEGVERRLMNHIAAHAVVPYDDKLVRVWAELSAWCRTSGRSISVQDSWIAATALRCGMPLVTHNRKHFEKLPGLTVISEA